MARGLRWIGVGAAAVALAAAVGWVGWATSRDDGPYDHTLVRFGDEQGEPNRYTNLDDGDAQLSVGSPDRHRLVVQWRDPDGHGWTAPETVWTDGANTAVENTVRYGGGTVAIVETYSPDTSSDSDIGNVQVSVVCRELTCTATAGPGVDTESQVTPDGRLVYVGQTERAVRLWSADDGFHRRPWSGHPGFAYRTVSLGGPELAPDGSLRLVVSHPARSACTFELLAGEPGTADLTTVARRTERLRGRGGSDCGSYLDTFSPDWLAVHPDDHRARDFWFVRDTSGWTTTYDDPSGLQLVDVSHGCCDTGVIGFVHWNDVAYGSPDGRRIQVQTHLLGEETWSEPELLEGAPAGYRCTWLEGSDLGDGFVLLMTCHDAAHPVRDEFAGDAYAVAATTDLEHWETAWAADVGTDPVVDHDGVRVGDLSWTPGGGFRD